MRPTEPIRLSILKPGWCTTVQDLGRHGVQHYGVSVSGAMDRRSLVIGNRLIGNRDGDAALEITLAGPDLLLESDAVLAITGADLTPEIDGNAAPLWTSLFVTRNSRLTFGQRRSGARCYLTFAGGLEVPVVWGSRSTHVASRTGGVEGRTLAAGDRLVAAGPERHHHASVGRKLPDELQPAYESTSLLRVVPGPQRELFGGQAFETLTTTPYRITSRSDRIGYRLEGQRLDPSEVPFISDGTAMGALQVPPDGQPILLMADRQTTGGYPTIAVVISADLDRAAQMVPGETLSFRTTTLPEARAILASQCGELDQALPPSR